MRVPALLASLLALVPASTPTDAARDPVPLAPLCVLETADDGARADGLVERRLAVYPDGAVIATDGPAAFVHGRLDEHAVADLRAAAERARLADMPAVVDARSRAFDASAASTTLRWSGAAPAVVRVEGDLRRHGPDRAFAPAGFVALVARVEEVALAPAAPGSALPIPERYDFVLERWTARDASPHADPESRAALAWPARVPAPRDGLVSAHGDGARALADAARKSRPVGWNGALWRVRARPLFPLEADRPAPRTSPESG